MGCPFRSLVPITPRVANLGYRAVLNDDVATRFENTEQSYTATCTPPLTGTPVEVTIPAGEYVSYQSQEIADAQALAVATAQAEAALECSPPSPPVLAEYTIDDGGTPVERNFLSTGLDDEMEDFGWVSFNLNVTVDGGGGLGVLWVHLNGSGEEPDAPSGYTVEFFGGLYNSDTDTFFDGWLIYETL